MTISSAPAAYRTGGLPYAIGAYLIWCLFPLYFALLRGVSAIEVVAWRLLFTLPFCLVMIVILRQGPQLRAAIIRPRVVAALALSGLLIGTNWLAYVIAVMHGHVLAASLGYYINPLMNVLAGTLFLRERLSRLQWLAVALAAIGVAILAWDALDTLWISLTLALSFCGYGLTRKLAPVDALPGLTIETLVLLGPALGLLAWQAGTPAGLGMGSSLELNLLLPWSGVLTGVPLLLFAAAARRLEFSTLGLIQFLTPTGVFLIGLFLFHEPLKTTQAVCFLFIWTAIAAFCWDLLSRRKSARVDRPRSESAGEA
ncbi:MAG TPA: EamA family transporter RarD [Novosphingobium sp.]|nr:EamA family transporter RarD [Novosphingobium sp.]